MRPSASPLLNPTGMLDKRVQPAWDQLEQVRQLLPQIAHVSYYLESIFNLDRNLSLLEDENVDHHILKDIQIFQGANAYETAVAEGYVGDVTSWLASLVGPRGPTGPAGVADTATLTALQNDIDTAEASAAAASALAASVSSQLGLMAPATLLQALEDQVALDITQSETDTLAAVNLLIDDFIDSTEAQTIAETVFDSEIVAREALIAANGVSIASADALIAGLRTDHDALGTAYAAYVLQNDTDIARIAVLEASDATRAADIISIQTVNSSQASDLTSLTATTDTHEAEITSLQTVQGSQASSINVLQVANNDNNAAIVVLQNTQTSQGTSIASLQTSVTANATAASNAQSTADGAVSSAATNTASIVIEQNTRAAADTANANSIAIVSATAAGNTASITTNANAIADIEGNLVATYAIVVDGGGNGAFISLEDGISTPSKITLSASLIELNGNVLIDGTVTTTQVGNDAITERLVTNDTSNRPISAVQAYTEIESVAYNKAIAASDIRIDLHVQHTRTTTSGEYAPNIRVKRNGVVQTLGSFHFYRVGLFLHSEFVSITIPGTAAGSATWAIDMNVSDGGNVSGVSVVATQLAIEEIKR